MIITGEVWAVEEFHIHGNHNPVEKDEYFRVKDMFQYSNNINQPAGVYIPRSQFQDVDARTELWVNANRDRIIEHRLPIVRYTQGRWTIDLGLVNRL